MLGELNINRLLENSRRSDVRGYNIYTCGKRNLDRHSQENPFLKQWDDAELGLHGIAAIGYQIDKADLILPVISVNGTVLRFNLCRNRWTPAYMDTFYRCQPFGEYQKSGLIAIRERKCFTKDDTFISHLTLCNDSRNPITLEISLSVPFEKISNGSYSVSAITEPRSLKRRIPLNGFACAKTNMGEKAVLTIPGLSKTELRYGFAFSAKSASLANDALNCALALDDPFTCSEERFNSWMNRYAPKLYINDLDLLKVYYYRFFVIKSSIHQPDIVLPESDFKGQCVYECPFGTWFGAPVGLPIPLQIEEMKWMKDTSALRANIDTWCKGLGVTQGYIQFTPMAIWKAFILTGDTSIISDHFEEIKNYVLKKAPDQEVKLPSTIGSWITGAEYQPAFYQYTKEKWDWRYDTEGIKDGFHCRTLYRVDECVMYAANLLACAKMATLLEKSEDASLFGTRANEAITKIKELFWNEEKGFFFDFDPQVNKQCDEAYGYDGFMPMMFSLFGKEYYSAFEKLDKGERFDSGFTLTSIGKDCPMYWFDNCITGPTASSLSEPHPYGCSWNGPVWPYAVSLMLEALGNASYSDSSLSPTFSRLFTEYTDLHFDYGDRSTPCICEHYRPTDAISFSPYTEYFHSEWINLFFSYFLGIRVCEEEISFKPLTDKEFVLDGIIIKGKAYCFSQKKCDGEIKQSITEL